MTIKDRAFRATRAIKLVQPSQPDPIGRAPRQLDQVVYVHLCQL